MREALAEALQSARHIATQHPAKSRVSEVLAEMTEVFMCRVDNGVIRMDQLPLGTILINFRKG